VQAIVPRVLVQLVQDAYTVLALLTFFPSPHVVECNPRMGCALHVQMVAGSEDGKRYVVEQREVQMLRVLEKQQVQQ